MFLCELALSEGRVLGYHEKIKGKKCTKYGNEGHNKVLPKEVEQYAEMGSLFGSADIFNALLADLNDEGVSFNEIADIIEKYWKDL